MRLGCDCLYSISKRQQEGPCKLPASSHLSFPSQTSRLRARDGAGGALQTPPRLIPPHQTPPAASLSDVTAACNVPSNHHLRYLQTPGVRMGQKALAGGEQPGPYHQLPRRAVPPEPVRHEWHHGLEREDIGPHGQQPCHSLGGSAGDGSGDVPAAGTLGMRGDKSQQKQRALCFERVPRGAAWRGMVPHGAVCDIGWRGMVPHAVAWSHMLWHSMVPRGTAWCPMEWHGMVCHGAITKPWCRQEQLLGQWPPCSLPALSPPMQQRVLQG